MAALKSTRLPMSGDPGMLSSSNDDAMLKHILATHAPDGTYFDVKPLLDIIENITHRANPNATRQGNQAEVGSIVESDISNDVNEMLEVMALPINKVSCEISSKCIGGGDAHTTTMGIFNMLSNYTWDAKAVITLAAFAVNYAEFWLVAQLYTANPLAKSVTHLKQLPYMIEHEEAFKPRFEAVSNLIKAMLHLTRTTVNFKELPQKYIGPETPELVIAIAHIPIAVYWIIQSIVACASIPINLIGMGHEHITMTNQGWDLSSLAHKISNFQDHLSHQLVLCYKHIDEKKQTEAYQTILRIMDTPHLDNTKPLKHLIFLNDNLLPLYNNSTKLMASLDILKKNIVLLLISDLDVSLEEIQILQSFYYESRTSQENQYEVVWIPLVPNRKTSWTEESQQQQQQHTQSHWTKEYQLKFEELRSMMPWYSVSHPSLLEPAVVKYIKEVWHFNHKPLLVVMDPQGRIVNTNALHMMWIWGNVAFPFSNLREEALWREETWRMELLLDSIEPRIFDWIKEGKYICLYGGEDMEWIRKFIRTAYRVARRAGIPLEMLYVGKSNRPEKVRKIMNTIHIEKLGWTLSDSALIPFFWARLERMLYSKLKHGKSFDLDRILLEINVMLTYDGNDQGWAVISRGSNDWMRRVNGETVLESLQEYEEWHTDAQERGFLAALNDQLLANCTPYHCNRLILPGTTGPDEVVCAECGRSMERFVLYRCCIE